MTYDRLSSHNTCTKTKGYSSLNLKVKVDILIHMEYRYSVPSFPFLVAWSENNVKLTWLHEIQFPFSVLLKSPAELKS